MQKRAAELSKPKSKVLASGSRAPGTPPHTGLGWEVTSDPTVLPLSLLLFSRGPLREALHDSQQWSCTHHQGVVSLLSGS